MSPAVATIETPGQPKHSSPLVLGLPAPALRLLSMSLHAAGNPPISDCVSLAALGSSSLSFLSLLDLCITNWLLNSTLQGPQKAKINSNGTKSKMAERCMSDVRSVEAHSVTDSMVWSYQLALPLDDKCHELWLGSPENRAVENQFSTTWPHYTCCCISLHGDVQRDLSWKYYNQREDHLSKQTELSNPPLLSRPKQSKSLSSLGSASAAVAALRTACFRQPT